MGTGLFKTTKKRVIPEFLKRSVRNIWDLLNV